MDQSIGKRLSNIDAKLAAFNSSTEFLTSSEPSKPDLLSIDELAAQLNNKQPSTQNSSLSEQSSNSLQSSQYLNQQVKEPRPPVPPVEAPNSHGFVNNQVQQNFAQPNNYQQVQVQPTQPAYNQVQDFSTQPNHHQVQHPFASTAPVSFQPANNPNNLAQTNSKHPNVEQTVKLQKLPRKLETAKDPAKQSELNPKTYKSVSEISKEDFDKLKLSNSKILKSLRTLSILFSVSIIISISVIVGMVVYFTVV